MRAAAVEAMLDSAERTMIQRGYEQATMQQIAAEAGCAIGTFYLYFKNKEELLREIVARHLEGMVDAARAEFQKADDPVEKIRQGIIAFVRYGQQHRPFFKLFFTAIPVRHRFMKERMCAEGSPCQAEYEALELEALAQAQKRKLIRTDLSPQILQEFMKMTCINIVEQFTFAEEQQSVREQMRVLWGLISGGIGASGSGHERG